MDELIEKWKKYKKQSLKNKYFYLPIYGKKRMILKYYKMMKGYTFDLDNPKTFSEKIQKRKLDKNKLFVICSDKYKVREYVKEKIGEKYLIPIYFAKSKITRKDIEELPNSFVLKTNNGSGTNIIVFDKTKENIDDLVWKMNYFVKIQYGYIWGEMFYNKIKPMIIAEKLLLNEDGTIPYDYKVHYFKKDGNIKIFTAVHLDRFDDHRKDIYDENWNKMPYSFNQPSSEKNIEKPSNLDEIFKIVKKLAEPFNYVRVDLYLKDKQIYFGELTFTNSSGYNHFSPEEIDEEWGSYWE